MTRGRAAALRAVSVSALTLAVAATPARAEVDGGADATAPDTAAAGDGGAKAEAQAAAAAKAVQDVEAQVIELQRRLDALNRQRAAFEDVRRRLDELDARLGETDGRALVDADEARDTSVIKFRDEGLFIRSPNRAFQLRPRVRVQTVYLAEIADAGAADQRNGVAVYPDRSQFSLAHAEVILEGHAITRAFEFRLQVDGAEARAVKDAYVRWKVAPALAIRAGQLKVPFGFQRLVWSGELEFVDRSAAMTAFSLERDVGLLVEGRPLAGRLRYEAGVLNGTGSGAAVDNLDMAYVARIVAAPFGPLPMTEGDVDNHPYPLVSGGVAGYYSLVPTDVVARGANPTANVDVDRDGRIDNVAVWQGGVELRALWMGAALQAELFSRVEDPGAASAVRKFWGGYLQASYFVLPQRLQVGARLVRTEQPLYGADAETRAARGSRVDEQSVSVSGYLRGHHAKLQLDYTHASALAATHAPEAHRLRAGVQLGF